MSASFSLSAANSLQGSAPLPARVLLINVCRGRCPHRPACPVFTGLPLNAAAPQPSLRGPILFCLARKEWGEKRRWRTIYGAYAQIFFSALFGRKIATILIAFGSDQCTTRRCGQTVSTSVLLISGILGRLRYCTAYCTIEREYCALSAHT